LNPSSQTLYAVRGDHTTYRVTVTDSLGAAVNLTGSTISFSVKYKREDTDANALIWKKNTAGGGSDAEIEIINAVGGIFDIKIVPADTNGTDPFDGFSWDIQFILSSRRITPIIGTFVLVRDVTIGPTP